MKASQVSLLIFMISALSLNLTTLKMPKADELEEEHQLRTSYETPHVDWCKGYAKGKIRGLFFVSGHGGDAGTFTSLGTHPREIIELAQRFDVEPEAVFMQANILHMGKAGEERLRRLLQKPYDIYVFGNASFEVLPVELQYQILERVVKGAGLVCIGQKPKKIMTEERRIKPPLFLIQGSPLSALPHARAMMEALKLEAPTDTELAEHIITAYQLKKGRGLYIDYAGSRPHALTPYMEFSFPALTEYEYWISFVGRGVLWAAGKESDMLLPEILADGLEINRRELPKKGLGISILSNLSKPMRLTVNFNLRRLDGWTMALPKATVQAKQGEPVRISLNLPLLRADLYFLEVIVRSGRGTECFSAKGFRVISDEGVEQVSLDRPFAELGERITGTVRLRGEDFSGDEFLRLRLRDSYHRVLSQQDLSLSGNSKTVPFSFEVPDWATILMRAEGVLMDGNEEVELKEAAFTVPKRRRGRFNFIMWDRPTDVLGYYAYQKLREAGMSVCLVGGAPGAILEACDISQIPYTTRILENYNEQGIMQPVCWNDESEVDKYVQGIVDKYLPSRQHGVFVYSLGDETTTKGCCLHPSCLKAYQRYLKDQYGTIESLNASWGSSYRAFDEIGVLEKGDNFENAAYQKGLYARWYDRQAFARYNFAQFCARFVRAYRELDPKGITGFEGAGTFGDDYETIIATNGFWSPYPSIGDEIIRSVAPRTFIRSNWMGYSKTADPLVAVAWRMINMGCDSVWWWRWDGVGQFHGYLAPTLDFWPATKELSEEMKIVRQGLGDLLLRSEMLDDGIAIFYSMPSAFANQLENSRQFVDIVSDHQAIVSATEDLGLQFRYITSRMLKEGALIKGKFKVLWLPFTQAIGKEEAKAISEFVESGGLLIADLRPGIYDDHCKPQEPGILDALLGIRRIGRGEAKAVPIDIETKLENQTLSVKIEESKCDVQVQSAGAEVLAQRDGIPLMLTRKVGLGRTILLNFHLAAYESERYSPKSDSIRQFLGALYALGGVKPRLEVRRANGQPVRATETTFWRTGDILIMSLRRDPGSWAWSGPQVREFLKPESVIVRLPKKYYVYNLRNRTYLGLTEEIRTSLRMGRSNFFALLPYEVKGIRLSLSSEIVRVGETLSLRVSFSQPPGVEGLHALYVEAFDPDGNPARWLEQVVLLEKGIGSFSVPVAYDEKPGSWSLRVTDLYSQKVGEIKYRVQP